LFLNPDYPMVVLQQFPILDAFIEPRIKDHCLSIPSVKISNTTQQIGHSLVLLIHLLLIILHLLKFMFFNLAY